MAFLALVLPIVLLIIWAHVNAARGAILKSIQMSETRLLLPRDSDAKYLGCFTVRKLRFPQISTTWAMVRPKDCPINFQGVMTYGW
ncbi:hypothetical protein I7I50_08505 [Histoplasma capsulatum G186AR]|uniref:Secreted protein n=1 Tax=Ajellomyces capsulatus TaxID=5037 RepID=A0A8H7YTY9_AJECA|nr:hypothetical protein I7I52_06020 [Histoplasma capsulatum]QSS73646.1 hypothetical protein I7I50_08505 [Histoplasma capsulatum G186AR]